MHNAMFIVTNIAISLSVMSLISHKLGTNKRNEAKQKQNKMKNSPFRDI